MKLRQCKSFLGNSTKSAMLPHRSNAWRRWYLGHRKDISLSVHDIPLSWSHIYIFGSNDISLSENDYLLGAQRYTDLWLDTTIHRFMVRAIALQLCRRSIIPTETFFKYCTYIGIIATIGNIIVCFFFAQYCNITKRWRLNWVTNWVVFMIKWNWNYSGFIWTSLFFMAESDAAATRDY